MYSFSWNVNIIYFLFLLLAPPKITNQRSRMLSVIILFPLFLFYSYILDKAVTATGYMSHCSLNRRAIPNQIGTNFFQYKLSSFTANLLSVSCANLRYGSQHFYLHPSIQQIKSFCSSHVFFSHFLQWPIRWNVNFFSIYSNLVPLKRKLL